MHHPRTANRALRHKIDRLRARLMQIEEREAFAESVAISLLLMNAGQHVTPAQADMLEQQWKHSQLAVMEVMERTPPPDDVVL